MSDGQKVPVAVILSARSASSRVTSLAIPMKIRKTDLHNLQVTLFCVLRYSLLLGAQTKDSSVHPAPKVVALDAGGNDYLRILGGPPGSLVPGWAPDLRTTETRLNLALLVKF